MNQPPSTWPLQTLHHSTWQYYNVDQCQEKCASWRWILFDKKQAEEKAIQDIKDAKALEEKRREKLFMVSCFRIGIGGCFFLFLLFNRFRIIKKQKDIIEQQKSIVEKRYNDWGKTKRKLSIPSIMQNEFRLQWMPSEKYIDKNMRRLKKINCLRTNRKIKSAPFCI